MLYLHIFIYPVLPPQLSLFDMIVLCFFCVRCQRTNPNPDMVAIDTEKEFAPSRIFTQGYGLIDVAWQDEKNVWAVGGSGIIFRSTDGGQSFEFVSDAEDIPGNLYRVKFFGQNNGFVLGSDGVLLKYQA